MELKKILIKGGHEIQYHIIPFDISLWKSFRSTLPSVLHRDECDSLSPVYNAINLENCENHPSMNERPVSRGGLKSYVFTLTPSCFLKLTTRPTFLLAGWLLLYIFYLDLKRERELKWNQSS